MTDVEGISTDLLVTEFLRRFDHALVMGVRVLVGPDEHGDGTMQQYRRWSGNGLTLAGMAVDLQRSVLEARITEIDHDA